MSRRPLPLAVGDRQAAELLDLKPAEFLRLVEGGHLPRGREIVPGFVRWDVDQLRLIASGRAADGMEAVQW